MKCALLSLLSLGLTGVACGQVYDTTKGKLEFVGLDKWTPEKLIEKLGYKSVEDLHACMADLKYKLGFADASVMMYPSPKGRAHWYTVVSVVEPNRTDLVSWLTPVQSVPTPTSWEAMTKATTADTNDFYMGVYDFWRRSQPDPDDPVQPRRWWPDLEKANKPEDLAMATKVLRMDRDPTDRIVAATVSLNFADKDEAWHLWTTGLRDINEEVSALCRLAMINNSRKPRRVDWAPATADLRAVLNGTYLPGAMSLMRALVATEISPSLAASILGKGGGHVVKLFLKAKHEDERNAARNLVLRLSGKGPETKDEDLLSWLGTLP